MDKKKFTKLQADYSLATKQLKGRKYNKERFTIDIYCNAGGLENFPLWMIGIISKGDIARNIGIGQSLMVCFSSKFLIRMRVS